MEFGFYAERSGRENVHNRISAQRPPFHHQHHHHHVHQGCPSPPHLHSLPQEPPPPHPPFRLPLEDARLLLPHPAPPGPPVPSHPWDRASILDYRRRINASLPPSQYGSPNLNRLTRTHILEWESSPPQHLPPRYPSLPYSHLLETSSFRPPHAYDAFDEAARPRHSVIQEQHRPFVGHDGREDMPSTDYYHPLPLLELASSRRSAALSARAFLNEGTKPLEKEESINESRSAKNRSGTVVEAFRHCKRSRDEELETDGDFFLRKKLFQESNLHTPPKEDHRSLQQGRRSLEKYENEHSFRSVSAEALKVSSSHPPLPPSKVLQHAIINQRDQPKTLSSEKEDRRHSSSPNVKVKDGAVLEKAIQTKRSSRRSKKKKEFQFGNDLLKRTPKKQFSSSAQKADIGYKRDSKSKAQPISSYHDLEDGLNVIERLKKSAEDVKKKLLTSGSLDKGRQSPPVKMHGITSNKKESTPCSGPDGNNFNQSLSLRVIERDIDSSKRPIQLKRTSTSTSRERFKSDLYSSQALQSIVLPENSSPFDRRWQDSILAETTQNSSFSKVHHQSSDLRIQVICASEVGASTSGLADNFATMQMESTLNGKHFPSAAELLPSAYQHVSPTCLNPSTQDLQPSNPSIAFASNRGIAGNLLLNELRVEGLSPTVEKNSQLTTPGSVQNSPCGGSVITKLPSCNAVGGTENCLIGTSIMTTTTKQIAAAEVLDALPIDKVQTISYKHLRKEKSFKKQKCQPDVRRRESSAKVVFPSRSVTPAAVPASKGQSDASVSASTVGIVQFGVSESHKHLENNEMGVPTTLQQPVQAAEGEVRLFGKALNTAVTGLPQQHEDAPKTGVENPLQGDQVMKPSSEAFQSAELGKMESSLSLSATMSNIQPTSPSLDLSGQQSKDAVVLGASASGIAQKRPAFHFNRKQLVHQFRRHVQANANSHTGKLSAMVTQPQYRLGASMTSGRRGAHTWRRSSNINSSTGMTPMAKVTSSGLLTESSQLADKHGAVQVAAYVRKGNSLVRTPVSSSLSASSRSGVVGKDNAGKLLHTHQSLQKGFSQQRSFKKSAVQLKKVSGFQSVHASHSVAMPTMVEKSVTVACNIKNITSLTRMAQMPVHAVLPFISTTDSNITHCSRSSELMGQCENHVGAFKVSRATEYAPSSSNVHLLPSSGLNSSVGNLTTTLSEIKSETLESSQALYIKCETNRLVAPLPPDSQGLSRTISGAAGPSSDSIVKDHYYKRKMNQLVLNGIHVKTSTSGLLHCSSGSFEDAQKVRKEAILQTKLGRVLKRKHAGLKCSWVWTLKGAKYETLHATPLQGKGVHATPLQGKGVVPTLFPWKRPGFRSFSGSDKLKVLPKAEKGSLLFLIRKKLQSLRKVQPVYTRSAHGFSLRRSGVVSLGGASLKWTKSIEKCSKKASEEATKAVAAVEKEKRKEKEAKVDTATAVAKAKADRRAVRKAARRERIILVGVIRYKMDPSKRTLQRLPVSFDGNTTSAGSETVEGAKISTPRRLSIGGTEYVRLGNGNQLVRNPKAATRALASEKVRWSLHTIRSRYAKKQQYCQFFTRFGKCNKTEGKCLYIHDPEKVAVCTKFLKGTCTGTTCLLTHKVIPERMPDCSYFLQGLCTNENCPYRHVNVNPKAPTCEGFLKGYCADGDQCNKKHTYTCTSYAATGVCQEQPLCKLHHPKKKDKVTPKVVTCKTGLKRKRRYFTAAPFNACGTTTSAIEKESHLLQSTSTTSESLEEFISVPDIEINVDEDNNFIQNLVAIRPHLQLLNGTSLVDDPDAWIKPTRLLQKPLDILLPKMLAG